MFCSLWKLSFSRLWLSYGHFVSFNPTQVDAWVFLFQIMQKKRCLMMKGLSILLPPLPALSWHYKDQPHFVLWKWCIHLFLSCLSWYYVISSKYCTLCWTAWEPSIRQNRICRCTPIIKVCKQAYLHRFHGFVNTVRIENKIPQRCRNKVRV